MIYDFLIIGGGIVGASAAYELAEQGTVLLLEAEESTGYHATGRSAALFTRNYGSPVIRQINAASAGFFRSPPAGFSETPLLTPRGCLTVADKEESGELDALLAMSEAGEEMVAVDAKAACAMVPFLRPDCVSGAVFEANEADIDVATLHLSYLKGAKAQRRKGAKARGAKAMSKQQVTALVRTGDIWTIQTATDSFLAAKVINAAGAWADQIGAMAGARPIGLTPKRRTAIIIKAPTNTNPAALPAVDFAGSDAYLKPEGGMLMASPGDATPMQPHDAWADDMDIVVLADWIEQETMIKVEKIEHSWAGLRSFVADGAPVVGFDCQVPDFFWLAGQGGYGIMMATALAILSATLLEGRAPDGPMAEIAYHLSPDRLY